MGQGHLAVCICVSVILYQHHCNCCTLCGMARFPTDSNTAECMRKEENNCLEMCSTCFNCILHFIRSRQCYGSCARSAVIEASLVLFHSANVFDVRCFQGDDDFTLKV